MPETELGLFLRTFISFPKYIGLGLLTGFNNWICFIIIMRREMEDRREHKTS